MQIDNCSSQDDFTLTLEAFSDKFYGGSRPLQN